MRRWLVTSLVMCLVAGVAVAAAGEAQLAAGAQGWLSDTGRYRVSYRSSTLPIAINRIHEWVVHLETASGEPVTGAELRVQGGMPDHDHGLPTEPRVTRELGGGDYLLEGLRFHMNGYWEIVVNIRLADQRDQVLIPLEL